MREATHIRIDTHSLLIGVLSVTACILFVGLMLVTIQPREAQAIGMMDRGGDYILATQQFSNSSEAIAVIDAAAKVMIVYAFDYNNKVLEILERVNLEMLPSPGARNVQPDNRRR